MEAETKLTIPHLMHSACRDNRAVLKKLAVVDLFKKVISFSTTSIFIVAFTKSCHWIRKYYTLLQIHFNIILPITPTTRFVSLLQVCLIYHISHVCLMPRPSHSPTPRVNCYDIPQLFLPQAHYILLGLEQRRQSAVAFCMEFRGNCCVLINSMEHRPPREAYRLSVGRETSHSS